VIPPHADSVGNRKALLSRHRKDGKSYQSASIAKGKKLKIKGKLTD